MRCCLRTLVATALTPIIAWASHTARVPAYVTLHERKSPVGAEIFDVITIMRINVTVMVMMTLTSGSAADEVHELQSQ